MAEGSGESLAWRESLRYLVSKPFLLVLFLVTLVDATIHNGYFLLAGGFLGQIGIKPENIMPVVSIGQVAEILTMAALGLALKRLGWKWTMIIGILGHAGRFLVFAFFSDSIPAVIAVQVLHGICYAFFFATRFTPGLRPARVTASVARTSYQRMKPGLLAQVAIDYPGAQVRLAFNGHVRHGQEDRTVICGSRGTLRSFGPSLSEQTVELHTAEGRVTPALEGTWFTNGFQGTMGELLCAIEEDREPSNSARDNLGSLALCFAALAAADTGVSQVPGCVTRAAG